MFRYLIFNGLKFQLDSICLGFAPHDITVIMWFWLAVVREKSTHRGGGVVRYFSQFRRGATTKLNTLGGVLPNFSLLEDHFSVLLLIIIVQSLTWVTR